MGRPSLVVVLAEDGRHQRFVRRYLERLGHSAHDIRLQPLPAGRGCGEQWVRQHYAEAVKTYRWRSTRAGTALIVAVDADAGDVNRRLQQVQSALLQAGLAARESEERIVHLIPKRSIETWILCLNGQSVDENADYSHDPGVDQQIPAAAATLFEWTRSNAIIPEHCIHSLRLAIPELKRLE